MAKPPKSVVHGPSSHFAWFSLKEADFRRVRMILFFRKKVHDQSQSRQLSRGGLFSSFLEQLGFVVYGFFDRNIFNGNPVSPEIQNGNPEASRGPHLVGPWTKFSRLWDLNNTPKVSFFKLQPRLHDSVWYSIASSVSIQFSLRFKWQKLS